MTRFALPGLACALASLALVGCGPMRTPLPARFDPDTQTRINEGWGKAFTPADRLARQELLDVMIGVQAYQFGVDTFSLRAEKRIADGKVVMEVAFDRSKPDEDRFEVSLYDAAGRPVRSERYSRKEIEETYDALFVIPPENPNNPDPPELAARRAAHKARWQKIERLFPDVKDGELRNAVQAPGPRAKG